MHSKFTIIYKLLEYYLVNNKPEVGLKRVTRYLDSTRRTLITAYDAYGSVLRGSIILCNSNLSIERVNLSY